MKRLLSFVILLALFTHACTGDDAEANFLFGKGVDATVIVRGSDGRDAYALAGADAGFEVLEQQIAAVFEEHGWHTSRGGSGVISAQSDDGIRCVVYYDARRYRDDLESSLQKPEEIAALEKAKSYRTLVFAVGSPCI